MASLQKKGVAWYCQFLYHGKRHTFALGKVTDDEAEAKGRQVDYLLMRLRQRLLHLPNGVDIVTFLQFDGNPPQNQADQPAATPEPSVLTLAALRDRYRRCLK